MKTVLAILFVAAVRAAPLDDFGPVESVFTGVANCGVLDIKDKNHENLEQFTQGLAEGAAAVVAADAVPTDKYLAEFDVDTPYNIEVITLPEIEPEIIISAPEPVLPKVVAVIEAPAIVEVLPHPAAQLSNSEMYDDENAQVSVTAPEDAGILATMQSWFNMVLNYFNNGAAVTQQSA